MKYLVDANLLSEPTKPVKNQRAVDGLRAHELELATSSVVMGEIWRGVDALPVGRKRNELVSWFAALRARNAVLDWTLDSAIAWDEMMNRIKQSGYTIGMMDTMIAATAKVNGLIIATRNVRDLQSCGVEVVNPFE